ncbi:MAG: arylsulfatase [Rikenellaceae bacterium]
MRGNCNIILAASSAAALSGCVAAEGAAKIERPNIVIIYADDMGYGDMSCQNPNSKIQTPNIDKLAAEGMRFTDGHSSCSVSSPSRYALLTGNYHWRRMTDIVNAYGESRFEPNEMTMPRMLKECGYTTAMVGKWHLGWDWNSVLTDEARERIANTPNFKPSQYQLDDFDWSQPFEAGPVSIGFDYYHGDGTINFPPYCWIENDRVVTPPTFWVSTLKHKPMEGGGSLRQGPAATDWLPAKVLPMITKKGVEVIKQQSNDKPFFLYLALSAPHAPIIPNEEFRGLSDAGYFGDFVIQCDDIVRQVEEALKEQGLEDNTIVIFTADNGAENYAYERMVRFDHNSTESLRGLKRDMWEGGHRVPFIVKWPKHIKGGTVSDEAVNQVDFMQTFADMVGYTLPNDAAVDSYNIMPVLVGESYRSPLREGMVHNYKNQYAIRQGDWVLIDNHTGSISKAAKTYLERYDYTELAADEADCLLYNIKEDRSQHFNKAEEHPELVDQLRATLKKYQDTGRSVSSRVQ